MYADLEKVLPDGKILQIYTALPRTYEINQALE